jgi:hypothetical protein
MKNEEFRKMFAEYAKEISDPENKKVCNEKCNSYKPQKVILPALLKYICITKRWWVISVIPL